MAARLPLRPFAVWVCASVVALFSWFYRFNDPGGSFGGLTDDHFFYLVRGWQILFGELPVRDFVDHGAPLFYYIAAAVQVLFGQGTLSELVFCVTVLSAAAAVTFLTATRAAGSIAAAILGTAFLVFLEPRFYNYPKILVYAAGIPLLWRFADRRDRWTRSLLAVVTVLAFLFRHDHGVFIATAVVGLLAVLPSMTMSDRLRHLFVYGVLTVTLVSPYLAFIQVQGGIGSYFRQAAAWAARDRERAEVVFPGLFENPDGVSEAAEHGRGLKRALAVIADNRVAWIFYVELALPFLALATVFLSPSAFRPDWPNARVKLATVAGLAVVLNAGFLRSPLEARLADPAVPHAVLLAWLIAAVPRLAGRGDLLYPALRHFGLRTAVRAYGLLVVVPVLAVTATALARDLPSRLDKAAMLGGLDHVFEQTASTVRAIHPTWPLERWTNPHAGVLSLAFYLEACTAPSDRVFVQHYLPQVLALGRRGFAGGHADLRPGFFTSEEAQLLTIARLRRQSVPVALLATGPDLEHFRESFPLISAYLDQHYLLAGARLIDGRVGVQLLVARTATSRGLYQPLGWPCFR